MGAGCNSSPAGRVAWGENTFSEDKSETLRQCLAKHPMCAFIGKAAKVLFLPLSCACVLYGIYFTDLGEFEVLLVSS